VGQASAVFSQRSVQKLAGVAFLTSAFFVALQASSQSSLAKRTAPQHSALPDIVFVQTPSFVPGPLAQRFPNGSSLLRLNLSSPHSAAPSHLTGDFFAAADPQPNFDATKILFSGQRTSSDPWQLWEMDLDGSHKRQITNCSFDCLRGVYLPAEEIAFTVETAQNNKHSSYLAVVKSDGSNFTPITFGTAPFQLETVLRDGRLVASAPWPLQGTAQTEGVRILYTLRPDGTALESFRCDHNDKAIQADAAELPDGSLLFLRRAILGTLSGGALLQIKTGDVRATSLGPAQPLYNSPSPISDDQLVVARQSLTAANSPDRFDLYLLDQKSAALGERLYANPRFSSLQPTPILPHAAPKHYWNTLSADSSTGNFISLNSYVSGDAAQGHIATPISRVRVLLWNPANSIEYNLGEAPVESDGSFFIQVPANAPVRFVLLDAKGHTIREEHGWVWTRPGEQRGCTGCHGDKAVAPDNHWPLTLRRFDTPTRLGESDYGSATAHAK